MRSMKHSPCLRDIPLYDGSGRCHRTAKARHSREVLMARSGEKYLARRRATAYRSFLSG